MERRSFIGGLLLSAGGAAAAAIARPIQTTANIMIPGDAAGEEIAEKLKNAKDGEIVIATPQDVQKMITGRAEVSLWFGVPDHLVRKMPRYNEWLKAHLEVNRSFGFDRDSYEKYGRWENGDL